LQDTKPSVPRFSQSPPVTPLELQFSHEYHEKHERIRKIRAMRG
jgi:hypothetical protein